MPTPLSHLAVPLVARAVFGATRVPRSLLAAGALAAVLPDADVLGYYTGVAYESRFGHRGFTHSLTFALLLAAAWILTQRRLENRRFAFAFVFACAASHGILDAFTNGGLGVAFFGPWSDARFFAPWRPIVVASIYPAKMFSAHGLAVLRTELLWIWLPALATSAVAVWWRKRRALGSGS